MEKSFIDIKVELNPVMCLKNVTVTLRRLSAATIMQYTRTSTVFGSQSDVENVKQLMERFCPACKEAVPSEKTKKKLLKNCCQKCGTALNYRCLKCKNEYKVYTSIYTHIQTKCGFVTRYSCSHCDYVTTNKQHIKRHTFCLHSTTNNTLECNKCAKQLKNIYCLNNHLKYCGEAPNLLCSVCDYNTAYKWELKKHLQRHSSNDSTLLSQAEKSLQNNTKYGQLIIRYCKRCDKTIEPSTFRGRFMCPKCKSKLSCQCAKCGFDSNIYHRMLYHVKTKCGARESQCPRCDKILLSYIQLEIHLRYCDSGAIASANDIPTADINNVDLGIVKVEKDTGLIEYVDASSETQDEAVYGLSIVKQETYIKEELMLSMSECSDDEGGNEFVSLKRKYDDVDDQLVPNVSKKFKIEYN